MAVSEMVERVAHAIGDLPLTATDEDCARAAITAMREPTEPMWGELARQLIFWQRQQRPTGQKLYRDLDMIGVGVPDWLRQEIHDTDHVPAKGTVAACIWKSMIDAALAGK
jgi:hypothetical protein